MKRTISLAGALAAGLVALWIAAASAQTSGPAKPWETPLPPTPPPTRTPAPPSRPPAPPPQGQAPAPAPAPATASPVIARVDGRPITQHDYDHIAEPYFERLKNQLGPGFDSDLQKIAAHNVLDELVRRELLILEARREKMIVTEAETDQILRMDPLFTTNGQFDPAKLAQYKLSPSSNYRDILPRLQEAVMADKMDRKVRASLSPSPAEVRSEWSKRSEQVRFKFLPLLTRDLSLDAESDEQEQLAYYQAHLDEFRRKPQIDLSFVRMPLPPPGDSTRAREEARLMARARNLADTLAHHRATIDSLAPHYGGINETGLFALPAKLMPGIGEAPGIASKLERAMSDTTLVLGPEVTPSGVVVATVAQHSPERMPAFAEVRGDVKRRADAEKRKNQLESDKLAYYQRHPDEFRSPRVSLVRVVFSPATYVPKVPSDAEAQRWYALHPHELFGDDTARAAHPPALNDSLRSLVKARIEDAARNEHARATSERLFAALRTNPKGIAATARAEGARSDTLSFTKDAARDSLFPPTLVDSLMTPATARAELNQVRGPRHLGPYDVIWRVTAADTNYLPPYENAKSRVESAYLEQKRLEDEADAKGWFDAHKTDYKTPQKWVVDYVVVRTRPDTLNVPEAEMRRFWEQHGKDRYHQDEQVRARHILLSAGASPAEQEHAKQRADSLRAAIVKGADFAELAKKFSQDPGSGAQGGDLGWYDRRRMVKEFSDTSFALPIGRVSQPVKTRFGYHLIQVQEKKPEGVRPFNEVKEEIRAELQKTRADSLGARLARRVLRQIPVLGALAAAKPYGGVQTSQPMAANDPLPGVGYVPELATAIDKLQPGVWASRPFAQQPNYVLVRVQKRIPPGQAAFEDVKRQAVDDMKNDQKKALMAKKVTEVRGALARGASLDSAAAPFGGLRDSGMLTRMGGFVPLLGNAPRVLEKAFTLKAGATSDSIQVQDGVVWIQPQEKKALQGSSFAKDKDAILNELLAKNLQQWLERKKKTAKIEVLRADLREAAPSPIRTVTTTIPGGGQ